MSSRNPTSTIGASAGRRESTRQAGGSTRELRRVQAPPIIPAVLDSAVALARTPLFAGLTRVELAKLAGELVEQAFPPGAVIVHEGDEGDAFYIVRSGVARVRVGANETAALYPGDGFGEMALLTKVPRTASVVARSNVTVWRLPVDQFRALLEREHGIALSIARTLSVRLASRAHELAQMEELNRSILDVAAGALSPTARRLLGSLWLLSRWPTTVLIRICERA